jgi:Electron transfer flavoprotein domain
VLSESRRVARVAGVTVFAVVFSDVRPEEEIQRIAERLGVAGADKVLLCEGPGLDAPPLDATHGPALHAAAERVPPLLVLFPVGGMGLQLGPPLAVRLGAAFAAAADLEVSTEAAALPDSVGRLCLRRWRRDQSAYRRLDPVEMERPVIGILGASGRSSDAGTPAVEVEVLPCPAAPSSLVELASEIDGEAGIAFASVLVVVDQSIGAPAIAKLTAAAPPGVVVVDLSRVSPAALAAGAPRAVLRVDTSARATVTSPRARVGVVLTGAPGAAAGRCDVAWRGAGPTACDELAAALPRLATLARGDGAP